MRMRLPERRAKPGTLGRLTSEREAVHRACSTVCELSPPAEASGSGTVALVSKTPATNDDPNGEWRAQPNLAEAKPPRRGTPGADPYNQIRESSPAASEKSKRRSLDDMRRLSETIKGAPTWTAPKRTSSADLDRRLAALRTELERVLAELRVLGEAAADPVNLSAELIGQLKDAACHLEDALDQLIPQD
jgi:hypothetical protein